MSLSRRTFVGLTLAAIGGRALAQGSSAAGLAAAGFRGALLVPESPDYRTARRMFVSNPRHPAQPRMIAVCADEDDVRRALAFARSTVMPLSVRSGGHDLLAASMSDGMVIDLSQLQTINVDAARRTVRVGAGVRSAKLNAALTERGLAAALGCAGQVGVSGLVLGGGLGWLVGKYGAACDHLVGARIITADGRILDIDGDRHPDLLWALRGGGGNFGIVTELTLRVHPAPAVTSGIVALKGDDISGFLRRLPDYLATAGEGVDIEPFAFPAPDQPMIFIKACHHGEPARAERTLAPLRKLGAFVADDLAQRPYTGLIDPTGPVAPLFKGATSARSADDVPGLHVRSVSMQPLGSEAADIIGEQLRGGVGSWAAGFAHYIHGAALRTGADHSPMPRIPGLLTTYVLSSWRRAEQAASAMQWIDDTAAALRPFARPTYLNYLTEESTEQVRAAYGPSFARLRRVKRRYDPGNIFHRGRSIPPA